MDHIQKGRGQKHLKRKRAGEGGQLSLGLVLPDIEGGRKAYFNVPGQDCGVSHKAARWTIKFFKGRNINSLNKYFCNTYVPDTKLHAGEREMTGFLY